MILSSNWQVSEHNSNRQIKWLTNLCWKCLLLFKYYLNITVSTYQVLIKHWIKYFRQTAIDRLASYHFLQCMPHNTLPLYKETLHLLSPMIWTKKRTEHKNSPGSLPSEMPFSWQGSPSELGRSQDSFCKTRVRLQVCLQLLRKHIFQQKNERSTTQITVESLLNVMIVYRQTH